jgi:hypothetical protein
MWWRSIHLSIVHETHDSPHDVAAQARRLTQAVIGQIHRSRGIHGKAVVELAIGAWEAVATADNVAKLSIQVMPGSDAPEIVSRLLRDTLIHLNDFLLVARGDANIIGGARQLIGTAVAAVTRHS